MGRRTALNTVRLLLAGLALMWGLVGAQFLWHLRHGIEAARGWLMHAALLGVPQEERSSWPQAIANVHHVYGVLIAWLLVTVVALVIERFLTVAVLKGTPPQSTARAPSADLPVGREHIPETGASPHGAAS